MRLGGQVFIEQGTPEAWGKALSEAGFRATTCPFDGSDMNLASQYLAVAKQYDIVIAEVGAWSNPISPDEQIAKQAIEYCIQRLSLANEIGAGVCVNIAGSRSKQWDAPHRDNLTNDTFALIVDTVRAIIDAVQPTRTFYALEMMPWVFPNSVDSYVQLVEAIDRKAFAVHFDPVNIVNSPHTYYHNDQLIIDFIQKLGPYIKNVHAKDIVLQPHLTLHFDEVVPGQGQLNYAVLLQQLSLLQGDIPIMIEHLTTNEQYDAAATYIRSVASELNLVI
ncbi:MAG TPA: sugar phosphate isomerase/epimerase [Candidatus Paenibacillus intestinavium]|nr:sugar phosphate isomerase/epimerase [Candidatus Paenibacillus intestinavium]